MATCQRTHPCDPCDPGPVPPAPPRPASTMLRVDDTAAVTVTPHGPGGAVLVVTRDGIVSVAITLPHRATAMLGELLRHTAGRVTP